jgi:hypothetical protein
VEAETAFAFTVSIQAKGTVRQPPRRLDLDQLPPFRQRFYVEAPRPEDNSHPEKGRWEFVYRLKPRGTEVTEVPSLPFAFYDPTVREPSRRFQTIYTDPIPLRVKPHQVVDMTVRAPEGAFTLVTGPGLLRHQSLWRPPGFLGTGLLLLAPPLGCTVWYLWWRRHYPDAARRAQQRRSRAARQALPLLEGARRLPPVVRAERVASVLAEYLRQRLDMTAAEPTPAESATLLSQRGCSQDLAQRAARLFKGCDAARFRPSSAGEATNLAEVAIDFLLAVEDELCPTPAS